MGKWHLGHGDGHDPAGFDYWRVLPDQGDYHDPQLLGPDGPEQHVGYVTDIITDLSLGWLEQRDPDRPFLLMVNHKARRTAPGSPTTPTGTFTRTAPSRSRRRSATISAAGPTPSTC